MQLGEIDIFMRLSVLMMVISMICKIAAWVIYQGLIQASENMESTDNAILKRCKNRFLHNYRLRRGMENIPAFVDRYLYRMQIKKFPIRLLPVLSLECMLLAILLCGLGVFRKIATGGMVMEGFPFYLLALLGVYAYLGISAFLEVKEKQELLKANIVDYLENVLGKQLQGQYQLKGEDIWDEESETRGIYILK
ncbi:MAG: hypothetical protein IJ291_03235 [Lachnospiraceae bacterium]|nr:hypothetical protein [Lachnospiraceae bacterium]